MRYKCIIKLKRQGLFNTIWVGESFNQRFYDKLTDEEKAHFVEDNSDESYCRPN